MLKQNFMQDPSFENQVHEKMEGLRFTPSESVWIEVERRIRKENKRLNPLSWLLLALGVALMGSLMLVGLNPNEEKSTPAYNKEKRDANPVSVEKAGAQPTFSDQSRHAPERLGAQVASGRDATVERRQDRNPGTRTERSESTNAGQLTDEDKVQNPVFESNKAASCQSAFPLQKKPVANLQLALIPNTQAGDMRLNKEAVRLSLASAHGERSGDKTTASNHTLKKRWYWGVQSAAGISTTYQDFFKNAAAGPVANFSATSPAPVTYNPPSEISPGFSFNGGVFAERVLSPEFSLTGGLNYHYYSNNIHTGGYVNNATIVYASNASPYVAYGYYQNGSSSTYTNQYHFLEIPVRVSYQINPKDKISFFTEAGCSLGWLLNSNALHYDFATGTYFKDIHLLNKTQVNASLAVEAGFYHRRALLKVGPELQYGLTNLLTSSTGQKQHLFFGGIKLVYIHAKK
jgi:hypothetical protein